MVTRLHTGDAFTNFNDDTGSLVAENHRENASGSFPERVKASVWQTPVWVFLISTSPFLGGATSISTISRGFPGANATAARDFIRYILNVIMASPI
jgi:hypothetical protein